MSKRCCCMFGSSQQDSLLEERRKDSSTCSWLVETGLARRDQQSRLDRALLCNGKGWWSAEASVRFSGWRLCDDRPCFGRALIPASAIHRKGLLTYCYIYLWRLRQLGARLPPEFNHCAFIYKGHSQLLIVYSIHSVLH